MSTKNLSSVWHRCQRGFSLVELMVAMTLGLIILGAVGYLYLGSRQTFRTTDAIARIQENARYALQIVAHDVRMAGYVGCGNLQAMNVNTIANAPVLALSTANAITGLDAGAGTMSFGSPAITRISTTDAISVMGAFGGGVSLTPPGLPPTAATVHILGNPYGFQQNDVLVVTNCTNADVFRVTNVPGSSGTVTLTHAISNNTGNRVGNYGLDAFVMKMEQYTYFIGTNLSGGRSLYRNSLSEGTVEVADNVWDMQILYGVDTTGDGSANVYQTATQVQVGPDWAKVVAARISLVLVSQDNVLTTPQTYTFGGAAVTPGAGAPDRLRMHQVFTTTVGVRNRLAYGA
jgi:type IV pilus assembly protein PilW